MSGHLLNDVYFVLAVYVRNYLKLTMKIENYLEYRRWPQRTIINII